MGSQGQRADVLNLGPVPPGHADGELLRRLIPGAGQLVVTSDGKLEGTLRWHMVCLRDVLDTVDLGLAVFVGGPLPEGEGRSARSEAVGNHHEDRLVVGVLGPVAC